jgi:hypothetical protein
MSDKYSLLKLFNGNEDEFIARMERQAKEIKKDKTNILKAADSYYTKYKTEIDEGTEKKKLLIAEGVKKGLSPEDTLKNMAVFIPSKQTPILNMLHYLLNENEEANDNIQFLREGQYQNIDFNILKQELNNKFGNLNLDDIEQDIPEILEYVYKNVTSEIFKKVKKLKALSRSSNKEEAFAAYTKCMELCTKYKLDFDKIPCNVN